MYNYKFFDYITESFNPDVWNVVGNDTTVNAIYSDDFEKIIATTINLLDETDFGNILFINEDIGFGADYLIFAKDIIPNSKNLKDVVIQGSDATYYVHLKEYEEIKFLILDIHSSYDYTIVFITKPNLEEMNSKLFPDEISSDESDIMQEEGFGDENDDGVQMGDESGDTSGGDGFDFGGGGGGGDMGSTFDIQGDDESQEGGMGEDGADLDDVQNSSQDEDDDKDESQKSILD